MKKLVFALFLLSTPAFAQQQPSPLLQAAIKGLQTDVEKLNQEVSAIQQQVAKEYPGYHLDVQTMSLQKDAPKPEAKPEPAKK